MVQSVDGKRCRTTVSTLPLGRRAGGGSRGGEDHRYTVER